MSEFKGQCFKASLSKFVEILENKIPAILVHANIKTNMGTIGHAWIECNNTVVDMTLSENDRLIDINKYYDSMEVLKIKKYSKIEVQDLLKRFGNKVYWEDWLIFTSK
ncbi:MAG: hypothetical protein HRT41_12870 [Campylobacteraceae bacterium]|nr:hypothetical protein [Campylobacteraceae bacterium]